MGGDFTTLGIGEADEPVDPTTFCCTLVDFFLVACSFFSGLPPIPGVVTLSAPGKSLVT